MKCIRKDEVAVENKKSLFEYFTEVMGWLQIFASPFLTAVMIGAIIYFVNPITARLIVAVVVVSIGLITGVIWATKVWRKKGTIHFMSRIMATPELDQKAED